MEQWIHGSRKALKFGIQMIWREPKNYTDDCFFCAINLTGIKKKKRKSLIYANLPSVLRPVAHCDEIPIPIFKELPDVPNENLDASFEDNDDSEL